MILNGSIMTHQTHVAATFRTNTFSVWRVTNGIIRYIGTFEIFRIYRNLENDACARADVLRAGWKDK